ncbi:hypothetical protein B5X24_HaOG200976 [Helicoverpa armigera]|nr:hypothetical protein B5X24_HaOG200976 [Helicoverpa armigera]
MLQQLLINLKSQFRSYPGLNAILIYRFIFGLYYDLSSSAILCLFARLYCILILIATVYTINFVKAISPLMSVTFYAMTKIINAIVNMLLSLITAEKHEIEFSSKVLSETGLRHRNFYRNLIFCYLAVNVSVCIEHSEAPTTYPISFLNITALNSRATSGYILQIFKDTVRSYRLSLINNFKNKQLTSQEKKYELNKFLNSYMKLIINLERVLKIARFKVRQLNGNFFITGLGK